MSLDIALEDVFGMSPYRCAQRCKLLTRREIEVVELLVQGLDRASIAERMGVSGNTIGVYRTSIQRKLGIGATGIARVWYAARCGEML